MSSIYELQVKALLKQAGIKGWVEEFKFHPTRRFRFDFAFPKQKIAVEVDGSIWVKGRHNFGKGMVADYVKLNQATLLGWRILRYTPDNLTEVINDLKEIL